MRGRTAFDDPPFLHHRDFVADLAGDAQIVGDEDHRHAGLPLDLVQQLQDLRLDRHVERRDRLVGDQQLRLEHQCPSDADALALPTGKFVRIAAEGAGIEPDMSQKRLRLFTRLGIGRAVRDWANGQDVADGRARVERREGVLEDHLDPRPQRAELGFGKLGDVAALEQNPAAVAVQQLDQKPAQRRFAGTALANDAQRAPGRQFERDLVDGGHDALRAEQATAAAVGLHQALDLQDRRFVGRLQRNAVLAGQVRNGRDKAPGIGMAGRLQDLFGAALLDDVALLHHHDAVGDLGHHPEVVGDEHDAHSLASLDLADQLQNLRLGGHVERGRRFIRDQDRGLERQRHGDHHPLPLPAREAERILVVHEFRVRQSHLGQQLDSAAAAGFRRADAMRRHDLVDLCAHGHQRIERRERVLKDHRHHPAAQAAQLVGRHAYDVHPIQVDGARGDADHPGQ